MTKAHALFRVEPHSRLVDDQYLRLVYQRLRYAEAANHATGELLDLAVGDGLEPHRRQNLRYPATPFPPLRQARHPGKGVDHLLGSMQTPGPEFLRQIADERAHLQRFPRYVVTAHRHAAPCRFQQGCDNAQQRALAGAVRAEEAEQPRAEGEVHIRKRRMASLVSVADAAGFDGWRVSLVKSQCVCRGVLVREREL